MKTADITIDHNYSTHFPSPGIETRGLVASTRLTLKLWKQRSQGRSALRNLSLHNLQDTGISHDQAVCEADKPFRRK